MEFIPTIEQSEIKELVGELFITNKALLKTVEKLTIENEYLKAALKDGAENEQQECEVK